MNKDAAQEYIEANIPITKIMGVKIQKLTRNEVVVAMEHAPNVNHQGSAFGGALIVSFM